MKITEFLDKLGSLTKELNQEEPKVDVRLTPYTTKEKSIKYDIHIDIKHKKDDQNRL